MRGANQDRAKVMSMTDEQEAAVLERPMLSARNERTARMRTRTTCTFRVFVAQCTMRLEGGLSPLLRSIRGYRTRSVSLFEPAAAPGQGRAAKSSAPAKTQWVRAASFERRSEAAWSRASHLEALSGPERARTANSGIAARPRKRRLVLCCRVKLSLEGSWPPSLLSKFRAMRRL